MQEYTLLIVEDDPNLAELTCDFFEQFEFACSIESDGEKALQKALHEQPDIILLDLMLPNLDGMEICKQLKGKIQSKIVMLTARTDTIDQVLGLEMGADDYVAKPVEPRLLLAKVRAVLRREAAPTVVQADTYQFHDYVIHYQKREVLKNGEVIDLSTPEYDLLCLLVERKGQTISREDIFRHLRGVAYDGQNRQADILISNLRAKLETDVNCPVLIKTVRSKGYLFVGN